MQTGHVGRNVTALCDLPKGQPGRPSKSLTLEQGTALLETAKDTPLYAYVVLSLLTGLRTEQVRALRWELLDLKGRPDDTPPVPPSVSVWRSDRVGGDTKTPKSRRTLALPALCVYALELHGQEQDKARRQAGESWHETGPVFVSAVGTVLDAANVRRSFRQVVKTAGLAPDDWTPRELRHSFVSIASALGMSLEQIADLVGHAGTRVTEALYRHQLRPVLLNGGGREPNVRLAWWDGRSAVYPWTAAVVARHWNQMSKADSSSPFRTVGSVAGIVVVALALTSRHWLPGYPGLAEAPAAGLVGLAVGVIVHRIILRLKDR